LTRGTDVEPGARGLAALWTGSDEADVSASVVWQIDEDTQAAVLGAPLPSAPNEAASLRRQGSARSAGCQDD